MVRPHLNGKTFLLIALYGGFVTFLLTTDPKRLPVGILLLPIVWLFLCLFIAAWYLLKLVFKLRPLSRSKHYLLSFLAAVLPSILLLLQSINQLTWRDTLLLLALVSFGLFYTKRLSLSKS